MSQNGLPDSIGLVRRCGRPAPGRGGFTLTDIVVCMAIVAVLLAILFPTFGRAKEASRRVVCASNQRQIGLALAMYADDFGGRLPPSVFLDAALVPPGTFQRHSHETVRVRLATTPTGKDAGSWDGLGLLASTNFIRTPEVFYCPSHRGPNRLPEFRSLWAAGAGDIVGNYQYRGGIDGPERTDGLNARGLWQLSPTFSLVSDGMRSQGEVNHADGMNVLSAALSVRWFSDTGSTLHDLLPETPSHEASAIVDLAWRRFDASLGTPSQNPAISGNPGY